MEYLQVRAGGHYIDCTTGAGGHSEAILRASAPDGRLLALDADPEALRVAGDRLSEFGERVVFRECYFDEVADVAQAAGFGPVDGLLCDLGVSSMQLDTPERGFSFRDDGPLDMRFGPSGDLTAADIVNRFSEQDLARILYENADERRSRRIARRIVERRPLTSTLDLAKAVEQAAGKGRQPSSSRVHPATKTFLALRMEVNQELLRLRHLLAVARGLLGFGSRIVVLSFHSAEDRIVKEFLRGASRAGGSEASGTDASDVAGPSFKLLTRKVVKPSREEILRNPRARSARLRAAEAL
jgi:16S rRNA (cytosine1402-N4)-methyltransferase